MDLVWDQALEARAQMDHEHGGREDLDGLPRLREGDSRVGAKSVPAEIKPGLAKRAQHKGLPQANWFSLDYESVRGLAETNFTGDQAYGEGNWRKGIPASNLINHALEHIFLLLEGDSSEPHIEHAMWNLGKLRWMIKNRPELIDVEMVKKSVGLPWTIGGDQ